MTFLVENLTTPDGAELRAAVREAIAGAGPDPDAAAKAALGAVVDALQKVEPTLLWATLLGAATR